jgi:hypothetical protein
MYPKYFPAVARRQLTNQSPKQQTMDVPTSGLTDYSSTVPDLPQDKTVGSSQQLEDGTPDVRFPPRREVSQS